MINLEAPTHTIPANQAGGQSQAGPTLHASGATYPEALAAINAQVPDGHRLTWIRQVPATGQG